MRRRWAGVSPVSKRSFTCTDDHIPLQLNRTGSKQLARALERLSFRQTLVEQAIELHKESRRHHIVDVPQCAHGAAGTSLKREASKAKFTVWIAKERAAGTEHNEIERRDHVAHCATGPIAPSTSAQCPCEHGLLWSSRPEISMGRHMNAVVTLIRRAAYQSLG